MLEFTISLKRLVQACFLAVFVVFMASCIAEKKGEAGNDEEYILPDTINMDSMAMVEAECLKDPSRICGAGLHFVKVGGPVHPLKVDSSVSQQELEDTRIVENDVQWVSRKIDLADGYILVEGDFLDATAEEQAVYQTPVNRIQIASPSYATMDGLTVGKTLGDLQRIYPHSQLIAVSIPSYESISIYWEHNAHLHYVIEDKGNQLAINAGEVLHVSKLPADVEISAIVVM